VCGRYALYSPPETLQRRFGLDARPRARACYNIAPGMRVPAITWSRETPARLLAPGMRWGFPMADGEALINARAETAGRKPTFQAAWRSRRCAVPFDAFFEWDRRRKPKQPWVFLARESPLAFAGLYWPLPEPDPATGARHGVAILTAEPNREVAPVHHRMPVILQPDTVAFFTDPDASAGELDALCRTPPDGLLEVRQAPMDVNDPAVDAPRLLGQPAAG
jgi:putative SOS response-associated peptidase YedK